MKIWASALFGEYFIAAIGVGMLAALSSCLLRGVISATPFFRRDGSFKVVVAKAIVHFTKRAHQLQIL